MAQRQPLKASMDYSSRVPDDYAIRKSLQMLHDIGITGVETPRLLKTLPYKTTPGARTEAFVDLNEKYPTLNIGGWSDGYKRAAKNDPKGLAMLASMLAHEHYHVQHGAAERPAYQAQLDTLAQLKGSNRDRRAILAAMRLTGD